MKKGILGIAVSVFFWGCSQNSPRPRHEIEAEVSLAFNGLYENYEKVDIEKFTSYYQEDVIRMDQDGNYTVGREEFKESWYKTIESYDLLVTDYSQPKILVGQDQVVTFNTYEELLIDKESRDTTEISGTWIGVWKQQEDGSWKLRMTTWH